MTNTSRWLVALLLVTGCIAEEDGAGEQTLGSEATSSLSWVGDTHARVRGVWLPPTVDPAAATDLAIYTQTYPVGAAAKVELFWADSSYASIGSAEMVNDADYVGAYGSNSQWRATLPGGALVDGSTTFYWIRAEDHAGGVLYDSRGGANFELHPRRYEVGWIGGLGSYRPVNGDYVVGGLFNDDGSTSTGCWNHGVSMSSYRSRAARVWVPGLTDRDWSQEELAAVSAMIRFEVFTDARAEGWSAIPAELVRREGNDFLYQFQFVWFTPVCVEGLGEGTFGFKLRASTDDGQSWFWSGTGPGPLGGYDLLVQYAPRCSYFNDPYDCIPTETDLTRRLPGGPVREWHGTPIGATSTFTKELIGGERSVVVSDLELAGPDADQFRFEVYDVTAGEYADPSGPFDLGEGDELRLILVHAPTVSSPGVLPQQATIVWTETSQAPPQSLHVTGIYLRGTTE